MAYPATKTKLFFAKNLTIPDGEAHLPALIWKANRQNLQIFAVKDKTPDSETPLFQAPFFNVFQSGQVCMGNVKVKIPKDCDLENFINLWQDYFLNSYFTHLIGDYAPVKGNIVQLWKSLVDTDKVFPAKVLLTNRQTLKNLIP